MKFIGAWAFFLILGFFLLTACLEMKVETPSPENRQIETSTTRTTTSQTIPQQTTTVTETPALPLITQKSEAPGIDLDEANVLNVSFYQGSDGRYTFSVTVRHDDEGWDHYADWWRIKTLEGVELARRVLTHPHDTEQPFTRSLEGIFIPEGTDVIVIEAHDNVHNYGGRTITVNLNSSR
jgi:hypothetical protein